MSFKTVEQAPARLNRSELAVPGSQPKLFEKAAKSAADVIFLDLEDAVAPDDKEQARKNIIQAIGDIDWGKKQLSVRINGLDTHYMYRDVVDVMEQAGDRLDTILVPKVGVPADLYAVEMLVSQIETAKGHKTKVGLEALIETALGMANVQPAAGNELDRKARDKALFCGIVEIDHDVAAEDHVELAKCAEVVKQVHGAIANVGFQAVINLPRVALFLEMLQKHLDG